MNIDVELYKIFCVVAESGSISKAAEKLYVSQPAITQSIKKLEQELKGILFYRIPKGIALTEEGKKLYQYLKSSIDVINNAENKFSQYINLQEGKISIKTGNSLGELMLYDAIEEFLKTYPNIKIDVSSGLTKDSIEKLSKGEVDLVSVNLPYETPYTNIDIIQIKEIQECFFVSNQYYEKMRAQNIMELIKRELIVPYDISNTGSNFKKFCEKNNIEVIPKMIVSSTTARKQFVERGLGIGFGIKESIQKDLDDGKFIEIKINKTIPKRKIGIAILNKEITSNAVLTLVDMIKK